MLVLPKINRKQTKNKVHQLLKAYHQIVRFSGVHQPLVTEMMVPDQDDQSIKAQAQRELCKIQAAYQQLSDWDQELLYDKYFDCNGLSNIAIYMKHHLSESKFYREMDHALIHFAEAYESGELLVTQP